jgi:hypothetical protein
MLVVVYIRRKQKGNLSMENIDIIYQRTIYREKAKGINFTLDDLYKSPIEHQQALSIKSNKGGKHIHV